jgi:RNA-dependent RNA polymerase
LKWLRLEGNAITVHGKKLRFFSISGKPRISTGQKMILEKAPYIEPDIDEQRQKTLHNLDRALRIDEVQFGVFHRPKGTGPHCPRCFSIEWRRTYEETLAMLRFEYKHKLIRIRVRSVICTFCEILANV